MASFFGKAKVKVAQSSKKNKFVLDHSHITTLDFFDLRPAFCEILKPGDSAKVNLSALVRLSPLVEPMMGDCRIVNRAFWVPCRTVQEGFNNFITDSPYHFAGDQDPTYISRAAYATNAQFVQMFTLYYSNQVTSGSYDFSVNDQDDENILKYKLTYKGKRMYNIVTGLGIKINFNTHDVSKLNILPLLAFCKVHYDWIKNPAYNTYDGVASLFKGKVPNNGYSAYQLSFLLDACYKVCYSSDYFTSAWDNPVSPNNNSISNVEIKDLSINIQDGYGAYKTHVLQNSDLTNRGFDQPGITNGVGEQDTGVLNRISDYMIQSLHKLTDYVKRRQLVGTRVLDRYLAQYGIQLDAAKLDRSLYLGKSNIPVIISDVMQSSQNIESGESTGEGVGDYSGKGFAAGSEDLINFSTDEWGYLLILSYIEPRVSYIHGRRKQYVERFDFFTDEFDSLGTEPIRLDELCVGNINFDNVQTINEFNPETIFGFTPRYSSFKTIQDKVTGDFMLNSKNSSLEGWILARDFSFDQETPTLKHNLSFTEASPQPFQNIWMYHNNQNTGNSGNFFDHFYAKFVFKYEKFSAMKPLFDYYDFDSDGKEVQMNVNGTQITE